MSNVSLIFDKKKSILNYSWTHYCEHPEMKKHLIQEKIGDCYQLRDTRTNNIVLSGSMPLNNYLKDGNASSNSR